MDVVQLLLFSFDMCVSCRFIQVVKKMCVCVGGGVKFSTPCTFLNDKLD